LVLRRRAATVAIVGRRNPTSSHLRANNVRTASGHAERTAFREQLAKSAMPLFRYLHDDAFLVFSRQHKHLYAACLLDLHERFFTGAPAFPTPQQVVHAIYDVMRANPTLWNESDDFGEALPEMVSAGRRRIRRAATGRFSETGDKALLIAHQLYARLLMWGWL